MHHLRRGMAVTGPEKIKESLRISDTQISTMNTAVNCSQYWKGSAEDSKFGVVPWDLYSKAVIQRIFLLTCGFCNWENSDNFSDFL